MPTPTDPRVTVNLRFPATGASHRLSAVRVQVEDVSRADAAARVVASAVVHDIEVGPDGRSLAVEVPVPAEGERGRRLGVRAHGSVSGAEGFASGDFLTTTSVAWPEGRADDTGRVDVPLQHLA